MLYHWELAQNFGSVHLYQSCIDFTPELDCTDVPQLVAVLVKRPTFYLVNVGQRGEEVEVLLQHLRHLGIRNTLGFDPTTLD